jgi:hypothetical protein
MSFLRLLTDLYGAEGKVSMTAEAGSKDGSTALDSIVAYKNTLSTLYTVEDVIIYFAKHSDTTLIKSLFCLPSQTPGYAPYTLSVVPVVGGIGSRLPNLFYTISKNGIFEHRNRVGSTHIPLEVWLELSAWFGLLRCIPFFSHYGLAKSVNRIRMKMRSIVFKRTRDAVGERIVFLRDTFRPTYTTAMHLIRRRMSSISLVAPITGSCTMSDWQDAQLKKVSESVIEIQNNENELRSSVSSLSRHLTLLSEQPEKSALDRRMEGRLNRYKSASEVKRMQIDAKAKRKRNAQDNRLYDKFNLLIEFLVSDVLRDICENAMDEFVRVVATTLRLELCLTHQGELQLSPSASEICDSVSCMLEDIHNRLHRSTLTHQVIRNGGSQSDKLVSAVHAVEKLVTDEYQRIDLSLFQPLVNSRSFYEKSAEGPLTLPLLADTMEILTGLGSVPATLCCGMFEIDASAGLSSVKLLLEQLQATCKNNVVDQFRAKLRLATSQVDEMIASRDSDTTPTVIDLGLLKSEIEAEYSRISTIGLKLPNEDRFNYEFILSRIDALMGEQTSSQQLNIE